MSIKEQVYLKSPVFMQNVALSALGMRLYYRRYKGRFDTILKELEKSQWYSEAELTQLQNEKLRNLIHHAYDNIPFYNRIFKERKLTPHDVETIDDLHKLPILTKEIIRRNMKEMLAVNAERYRPRLVHTSGSTGEPFILYLDKEVAYDYESAFVFRHRSWLGVTHRDKRVTLRGYVIKHGNDQKPPFWRYNLGENELLMSVYHLKEANIPYYIDAIMKFKPDYLFVFSSSLDVIARYMERNNIRIKVKGIFPSSEILHSDQRARFGKVFNATVLDWYGLTEMVISAGECPTKEGYHLNSEYGITEIIQNGRICGKEEAGNIIGTSLNNYSFPLIRYDTNDIGVLSNRKCSCGRGLPLLKSIEGRVDDMIICPDGSWIAAEVMYARIQYVEGVKAFKVIQPDIDRIIVNIVPDSYHSSQIVSSNVRKALRNCICKSIGINVNIVSEIQKAPSGKTRCVESFATRLNRDTAQTSNRRTPLRTVLIVGAIPPAIGGIATNIDLLVNSNLRQNYNLLTFDPAAYKPLSGTLGKWLNKIWALYCFDRILHRKNIDLIHIFASSNSDFWIKGVFIIWAKLRSVKVLLRDGGGGFKTFYYTSSCLSRYLIRKILNLADRLIVVSDGWKIFFQSLISPHKIVVIHNGIKIPKPGSRDSSVSITESLKGRKPILFVGMASKDKGIYDIIRAMPFVFAHGNNTACVIVAGNFESADEEKQIISLCKEWINSGLLHFTGPVEGAVKQRLFEISSLFILPSYMEGFPNVILEAMASGLPVIATDVGAIPEVIREGENGFIISSGDHLKLAERINFLLNNSDICDRIRENNVNKVKREYDYDFVVTKLDALYRSLLTKESKGLENFWRLQAIIRKAMRLVLVQGRRVTRTQRHKDTKTQRHNDTRHKFFINSENKDEITQTLKTVYPQEIKSSIEAADKVLRHTFDLLGSGDVYLGERIDWHADFKTGVRWPLKHYSRIDVMGFKDKADIKVPWELSRCYHFVTLGKAYWLTEDEKYAKEWINQFTDWLNSNPVEFGVSWACSMEVAIRAVNWIWGYYFFFDSPEFTNEMRIKFLKALVSHGRFIFENLENTGIKNNHYLASLVGLIYIGALFPEFKDLKKWLDFSIRELEKEIEHQFYTDGGNFEASISYHRLGLEMALSAFLLLKLNGYQLSVVSCQRLEKMFEFVMAYTKPDGTAPNIGDSDDGRLHILSEHTRNNVNDHRYLLAIGAALFSRTDFKKAAGSFGEEAFWLLGVNGLNKFEQVNSEEVTLGGKAFEDSGIYVMRKDDLYMIIDAGGNGQDGNGGHAHNDALSFELYANGKSFIVDPGTYLYTPDLKMRNEFRSTKFHNTVMVDGKEIAGIDPRRPFRLKNSFTPKVTKWKSTDEYDIFEAERCHCEEPAAGGRRSNLVTHRRNIFFDKQNGRWMIKDVLDGEGIHKFDLYFHFAPMKLVISENDPFSVQAVSKGANLYLSVQEQEGLSLEIIKGCVSRKYGIKEEAYVAHYSKFGEAPVTFVTTICPFSATQREALRFKREDMILARKE